MTGAITQSLKGLTKSLVPPNGIERIKRLVWSNRVRDAQAALAGSSGAQGGLTDRELAALCGAYPVRKTWAPAPSEPDVARARAALKALGGGGRAQTVLDAGGGPGYVGWAAALQGHRVTCADILDELDPAARRAGVESVIADTCRLPMDDNTYDGLWSYNSFEHFHDPDRALSEFHRVVRPGGRIHLSFAPLYNAPLGLHAFHEIGVPFCQHLWSDETILPRVTSKDLWCLNRWSLTQYRELWAKHADTLDVVDYSEGFDFQGLELIHRYPHCFTKVSRDIEDFVTSKIVVTFRVRKTAH